MSNIDEIKNKYSNNEYEEEVIQVVPEVKTSESGAVRYSVGIKRPQPKKYVLYDIFGNDYEINHKAEVIQTIGTIMKAMKKIKDSDEQKIEKIFTMFEDIMYVIFKNKEDAKEIIDINSQFELVEQIQNYQLITQCALSFISGKSVQEIDEMVKKYEVSEEQEVFRDDAE